MKRLMTILAAATIATTTGLAVQTIDPSPAHADGCAYGGFGGFGGGYCDTDYWPDGSFYHCVTVAVFGYGSTCNRVCPGNPPAPYPGPGPGGRC